MSRNFQFPVPETQYQEKLKPLLIPADLDVPEALADRIPQRKLREIRGVFLLRFYPKLPPQIGDTLTRNGHRWAIVGREFRELQVHRSTRVDSMPVLITEYLGEV
jgi:hypothetical protein